MNGHLEGPRSNPGQRDPGPLHHAPTVATATDCTPTQLHPPPPGCEPVQPVPVDNPLALALLGAAIVAVVVRRFR
jgi:hypothetical protein